MSELSRLAASASTGNWSGPNNPTTPQSKPNLKEIIMKISKQTALNIAGRVGYIAIGALVTLLLVANGII